MTSFQHTESHLFPAFSPVRLENPWVSQKKKKQLLHNLFSAFDIMKLRRQNGELHYPKMLITVRTELRHLDYEQCIENSRIIHEQKTSHINTAGHFNTGMMVLRSTKLPPPPTPIREKRGHTWDKNQCVTYKTVPVSRVLEKICLFGTRISAQQLHS